MDTKKIASFIMNARKKLKMTQQELADQLGVTAKAVSKWERGVNIPDVSLLLPLSRILGLSVQELLGNQTTDLSSEYSSSLSLKHNGKEGFVMETSKTSQNLHIDMNGACEFSPYVFGHNLEHTRACMATGLNAQVLRNRKFAGKPSKNEGCPAEWFAIGGQDVFMILDGECQHEVPYTRHKCANKMPRLNENQAFIVQNLYGEKACGFGQQEVALTAGQIYEMRIVSKCQIPVPVQVQLTDRKGTVIYAQESLALDPGQWQSSEFTMVPDQTDPEGCIRITFTEKARVVFGAVSMLPEGHFLGMRRDVMEDMKTIGATLLRWPGGNFAGEYRWQDGLLPVDMRGPLQSFMEIETHPYTHGYDTHEMGTDEFIAFCREVGAEPFITINPVWNTPEENAAWVEYCNGSVDTEYGRLRAERGHAEPYNVKFWSLGNEMGYPHMEGGLTPEHYASIAKIHAKAMLEVDPDLKLFSSGPYPSQDWADKSAKVLADKAKYVSLHFYTNIPLDYSTPEAMEKTCKAIFSGPRKNQGAVRKMRECLGEGIHISFDEWNCWYTWYRPSSVAEGIYTAGMLHMLMYESGPSDMPVCCYFQPVGEGAIEITSYESSLTANGQVFSLMKAHIGGKLCRIGEIQDFEAAASIRDGILTVTLINTNLEDAKVFTMKAQGQVTAAELLSAENIMPHSRFTESALEVAVEDGELKAELPPHSVAKICMRV